MRSNQVLVALSLLLLAGSAIARQPTPCCLEVSLPGVTNEPRCMIVNLNVRPRRVRARGRTICRLLGGSLPVRGSCGCAGGGPA